nr:hypothetical protein [Tanacetum cinerariifolium]
MLLFLVQGKLTNLTIKERFALNVSLRMFTRSIFIQRRMEDLQLGVKSYQKKLNLIKPDTCRSDLKCKEAYTTYSNLRGFIFRIKTSRTETCATLTKQVVNLEQDKVSQAIKITKLKQRVRRRMHPNRGKTIELNADEDVTLEEVDAEVTKDADVQGRLEESQAKVNHLDLEHDEKVLSMQDTNEAEPAEVEEVIKVVNAAKLMTDVVTTATTITIALVPKASAPRRRRGVIIQDPEEATTASVIVQSEVKSKDRGKETLVKEPKPLKRQAQIEPDEAFARELEAKLNANINWNDVVDQVKRKERKDNTVMRYQALKRKPVTEAHVRKNMMSRREVTGQDEEEGSKRKSESSKQRAAKKQRIDEEVEELKTHLQIVANDDDDVSTGATPLELKVPVVDYQIHHEHNKPYYKIIRADGTHKQFLSFITLLRNFHREDLEML